LLNLEGRIIPNFYHRKNLWKPEKLDPWDCEMIKIPIARKDMRPFAFPFTGRGRKKLKKETNVLE